GEMAVPSQPSLEMRISLYTLVAGRHSAEEIVRALVAQALAELRSLVPPPGRVPAIELREPGLSDEDLIDRATQAMSELFGELEDRAANSEVFLQLPGRGRRVLVVGGAEKPAL